MQIFATAEETTCAGCGSCLDCCFFLYVLRLVESTLFNPLEELTAVISARPSNSRKRWFSLPSANFLEKHVPQLTAGNDLLNVRMRGLYTPPPRTMSAFALSYFGPSFRSPHDRHQCDSRHGQLDCDRKPPTNGPTAAEGIIVNGSLRPMRLCCLTLSQSQMGAKPHYYVVYISDWVKRLQAAPLRKTKKSLAHRLACGEVTPYTVRS